MTATSRTGPSLWLLVVLVLAPAPLHASDSGRWYCVEIFGTPAGWMRDTERSSEGVRELELQVHLTRMGTAVDMWTLSRYVSDPQPVWTTLSSNAPEETTRVECRPTRDELEVHQSVGDAAVTRTLPRPADLASPDRLEDLFAKAAQEQTPELIFSLFSPELMAVPRFHAYAEAREDLVLPTGARVPCTRWRVTTEVSPGMTSLEWRDHQGTLRRIEYPSLQMSAEECPPGVARDTASLGRAELTMATTLATEFDFGSAAAPSEAFDSMVYQVRYPVTHRGLPIAETPSTELQVIGPGRAQVTVRRIDPEAPPRTEPPGPVGGFNPRDALRATALLQSDHPLIRETAARVAGPLERPWEKASRLCAFVYEEIRTKNLAVAFGSALQTLQSGEGDCTEHAVLLAALCRAQGIPSRLTAGLIGTRHQMGYHLWTEVMIRDRWIGLDGAFGRAPTDARYLAIATTDLLDDSTAPLIYGILDVVGAISVEVVESSSAP